MAIAGSNRIKVISADMYRHGSVYQLDGYHYAVIGVCRNKYSFDTVEAASTDAHSLPRPQEGMVRKGNSARDNRPYVFYLFVGNWDPDTSDPDETQDAHCVEDGETQLRGLVDVNKDIAWKQRKVNQLSSVGPLMNFVEQG